MAESGRDGSVRLQERRAVAHAAMRTEFHLTDPVDDPDPMAWRTELAYLTLPDGS